ncbi:fimbrial protein [Hafnia paralvei]|uniref:fimbrial protein n=1 Tax=Hafnia paralvei TaxID=546367 RepID=UPI0010338E43|nr:fimbrial protein [Hafnia paralvei]TBL58044.1 fimbrial protein [Hafnia paralvei]
MKKVNQFSRRWSTALILAALAYTSSAQAWIEGEIVPNNGTHEFQIDLGNLDIINNVPGETISKSWDLGGTVPSTVYCTSEMQEPNYYTTRSTMTPSTSNPGYYYLNEYFDVKIDVWLAGSVNSYVTTPWFDESNQASIGIFCSPPSARQDIGTGSKGRLIFKLKKSIINGVTINTHDLMNIFAREGLVAAGLLSSIPISKVSINSGIITVPDKCIINQGMPVSVEFGAIPNTSEKLDGNNYVQQIPIQVQCKGGSFETGALNIKLGIQSAGSGVASFNSDYLGTSGANDRRDLGIVIKDSSGSTVVPNQFYDVPGFNNNQGVWNLTAAPIANPGSIIPEGEFDAAATVVAQFQ